MCAVMSGCSVDFLIPIGANCSQLSSRLLYCVPGHYIASVYQQVKLVPKGVNGCCINYGTNVKNKKFKKTNKSKSIFLRGMVELLF
jgi:hypothetical protein